MANISLRYYLISRYVAILIVLILLFAFSIIYLQLQDMDDTSAYYMDYEAQMLSSTYQVGDDIKEFDLGFKEYYWGLSSLPEKYQVLIADTPLELNQLNWYQNETDDIYIYPFQVKNSHFVVVHLFSLGDYGESFSFTSQFLFISALLLLLLIIATIVWVSRNTVTEMTRFSRWVEALKETKDTDALVAKNLSAKTLRFTELQEAAETLINSRSAELKLQKQDTERVNREKAFLSTLSHELRTPIAIINAATTLLEKRGSLSDKDAKTLAKLSKANGNMKKLANTLLQLWRKQESNLAKSIVNLQTAVDSAIDACQQSMATDTSFIFEHGKTNQDVQANTRKNTQTTIKTYPELMEITLQNILRNACQYSANNKVIISINTYELTVRNTIDIHLLGGTADNSIAENSNMYPDYGFGLGLYLVENICVQQNWKLKIDKSNSEFCLSINFSN